MLKTISKFNRMLHKAQGVVGQFQPSSSHAFFQKHGGALVIDHVPMQKFCPWHVTFVRFTTSSATHNSIIVAL
jgi:hypothetical protein